MSESSKAWSPSVLEALPRSGSAKPAASVEVDIEKSRQQGYDAGYAEGLATGRARGEALAGEMAALLEALAVPFREADAAILRELLELTERVARAVVRRELQAGIDIEAVLADAVTALGSVSAPIQLTLHPNDATLCRDLGLLPSERFAVREDTRIERGGLQLQAGTSFVDATVEARLEAVLATLRDDAGLPDDGAADERGSDRVSVDDSSQDPAS